MLLLAIFSFVKEKSHRILQVQRVINTLVVWKLNSDVDNLNIGLRLLIKKPCPLPVCCCGEKNLTL